MTTLDAIPLILASNRRNLGLRHESGEWVEESHPSGLASPIHGHTWADACLRYAIIGETAPI